MKLQELNLDEMRCTNGGLTLMPGTDTPMVNGTPAGTGDDEGIIAPEQPTMFSAMQNRLDTFKFRW